MVGYSPHTVVISIFLLVFTDASASVQFKHRAKRGWLSGPTSGTIPPGRTCAFNPCTVQNFCGTGRTCEIDENCVHECKCDADSAHEHCQPAPTVPSGEDEPLNLTTTPKPVICTFNPCYFPCSGNRLCEADQYCKPVCSCTEYSTHESCSNDTKTTTTESTDSDNSCDGHILTCGHGKCLSTANSVTCVCEEGWGGVRCDRDQTICSRTCNEGFECQWHNNVLEVCVPVLVTIRPPESLVKHVCSDDYTLRPKSEQYCSKGHYCKYGICEEKVPGQYKCKCDEGAYGELCLTKCCLVCNNGVCLPGDVEKCNCHVNYTGETCVDLKPPEVVYGPPEEVTWYLWLVGVCVVVLVILVALLVVAPYIMWRYRNLMVMKIVHYFQKYEDDDDREWDAFVSYKSSKEDEHFVVHTLFPRLEKEFGFKLHLHFRDFIPGDTISNNIIRAVQGSRRTIMIISPQYIQSEFIRFEYEMAQQEMMKRKHRMLPILLEDISECKANMDPNLKVILNSVTYIEWPKNGTEKQVNTFWKKVQLSLPKKRHMEPGVGQTNEGFSTKPDDIILSFKNEKDHNGIERHVNDYTTIDDTKLEDEEVYDIINDDELERDNGVPSRDIEPKPIENINPNKLGTDSSNDVDANVDNKQANKEMQQNYLNFLNSSNT